MELANVNGNHVVLNQVTGVSKVKSIDTGKAMCDWLYGYTIKLVGGEMDITFSSRYDDRDADKEKAEASRKEFLNKLHMFKGNI